MINIKDKMKCCGCTACTSICPKQAIKMEADDEGFLYPKVDFDKCIDCHLCEKVCPISFRDSLRCQSKPLNYMAGRLSNYDDLMVCSSGGAFWALAKETIANNGIVVGAEYSSGCCVIHGFAETLEECKKFRGSKYSQSNIVGVFSKISSLLQSGKMVLFSGTPCQVEGLNLFLRKSYENLITVDLLCHAVPSPKIFEEYCNFVGRTFSKKLSAINMRDKTDHGWGGGYSYKYIFSDGSSEIDSARVSNWGRIYFSQYINRPSCYSCRFTNLHRAGDITIGDFWDLEHNRNDISNKNGTSLILINTERGKRFFDYAKKYMNVYEITEKESLQPCLLAPPSPELNRQKFWNFYHRYGFLKTYKKFFSEFVISALVKKIIPLEIKAKVKKWIRKKMRG